MFWIWDLSLGFGWGGYDLRFEICMFSFRIRFSRIRCSCTAFAVLCGFALMRCAKPTLQLQLKSGIGGGFISGAAGGFRVEKIVFREKMIFYKMSRAVFFEKFGGEFFLQVGSGHFLESYAVFWGLFTGLVLKRD
jgi:hypothetical protein